MNGYEAWRRRVDDEVAEHRARGKTPAMVPATEEAWQELYAREPRSVYAAWWVLTGRRAGMLELAKEPRCGAGPIDGPWCDLAYGHEGPHRDRDGREWEPLRSG